MKFRSHSNVTRNAGLLRSRDLLASKLALSFLFAFSVAAYAENDHSLAVQQQTEASPNVTAEQWFDQFKQSLPAKFCAKKLFFRQCFHVSYTECQAGVREAFAQCASRTPASVPADASLTLESSAKIGEQLGACVGSKFETLLAKNRKSGSGC